jgi:hypothetical protein
MELIEQLYFRAVTPSDFRNIYELAVPNSGHGQTYIEAAGISDDSLRSFLSYAEQNDSGTAAEPRPTYIFNCHVLGDPQQQDFIEFAPRRGRNYKISRQTTSNRHPAWRPSNRFPEPHRDSTGAYIDSPDFAGIIDNLIVVVIRSSHRKYYAWFCNEPSMPESWPKNIGLESLFIGKRRGILSFDKCQVQLIQNQANPFRFISGSAATLSFRPDEQYPYQRIFYGAPGTGKSYQTNGIVETFSNTIRTTFHPDSDYASFVGCYKPTMREPKPDDKTEIWTLKPTASGSTRIQEGEHIPKGERIVYEFVPQAFTKAYVLAWEKVAKTPPDEKPAAQFLVIEEINRGNCAQIFGDLFQLLDRDGGRRSTYPIVPDGDLGSFLAAEFKKRLSAEQLAALPETVREGRELVLPPNFFIWATMNTSDQSLFPIDSAFKRRWEWTYVPIADAGKEWTIEAGGKSFDWWKLLEKINASVRDATQSEDKQLGYFFAKPPEGEKAISLDTLVNKVLFFLFGDVFKDDAPPAALFGKPDGNGTYRFRDFFTVRTSGGGVAEAVPDEGTIAAWLGNLGVEIPGQEATTSE